MTTINPITPEAYATDIDERVNIVNWGKESPDLQAKLLAVIADELGALNHQLNDLANLAFHKLDDTE